MNIPYHALLLETFHDQANQCFPVCIHVTVLIQRQGYTTVKNNDVIVKVGERDLRSTVPNIRDLIDTEINKAMIGPEDVVLRLWTSDPCHRFESWRSLYDPREQRSVLP